MLHHKIRVVVFFFLVMLIVGCRRATPVATSQPPELREIPAQPAEATASEAAPAIPKQLVPSPSATGSLETGLVITPTASLAVGVVGSSTPCALPGGWIIYTIQPGDTLQKLAGQSGSSVEELMAVNCLSSDLIKAYETIFLPHRPPSAGGAAQPGGVGSQPGGGQPGAGGQQPGTGGQQPGAGVDCNANLSCVLAGATLPILAGGPGNPSNYEPCKGDQPSPWLDVHGGVNTPIPHGERIFFYACDFTVSGEPTAQAIPVTGGAPVELEVYIIHPVLNQDKGNAQVVIDFAATPDMPIGDYIVRLTVGAQSAERSNIRVELPKANKRYILPVPLLGAPGDVFQVYYVNYPLNRSSTFILYSAEPPGIQDEYDGLTPRSSWTVDVIQPLAVDTPTASTYTPGWAVAPLAIPGIVASPNAYAVADEQLEARSVFWIK